MSGKSFPQLTFVLSAFVVVGLAATALTQQPAGGVVQAAPPSGAGAGVYGSSSGGSIIDAFGLRSGDDVQLDRDVRKMISAYSSAKDDGARSEMRQKLADALSKQFDARQKRREQEIADLESRVQKLRDTLRKRNDAKPQIVNSRLDQLLRDAEGLGWGDGEPRTTSAANSFYRALGEPAARALPGAPSTTPARRGQ